MHMMQDARQIVAICDKENEEEFLKRPGVIEDYAGFFLCKRIVIQI